MKKLYTLICLILLSFNGQAQTNYEFGLVHLGNYSFKVVAIPDFDSAGNTDISDVGFTMMLPAGTADVVNAVSLLPARTVGVTEFDAGFLTGLGLGDGTKDAFQINIPPGSTMLSHTTGQMIDLVSFDISNMPTTGELAFLLNSDPIAMGAGGVLDSFYNANIGTGTNDYFSNIAAGMGSFFFSTLSMEGFTLNDVEFKAFPVPSNDIVNIHNPTSNELEYSVMNLLGQNAGINGSLRANGNTQLSLGKLEGAIYFVTITNGTSKKTLKIIIE